MDDLTQTQQLTQHIFQLPGTSKAPPAQHVTFAPLPVCPPSKELTQSSAGPIRRRRFSAAKIQPTRIKKVMQSDEEIGRMVASVPVAIGRAMEHFAEKFLLAAAAITQNANCRTLTPAHMKIAAASNLHFRFLENVFRDTPTPVTTRPNDLSMNPALDVWKQQLASSMSAPTSLGGQAPDGSYSPMVASPMVTSPVVTSPMVTSPMIASPQINNHNSFLSHGLTPETMQLLKSASVAMGHEQPTNNHLQPLEAVPEKVKRGRPKKLKKEDKCLDEELCREVTDNIEKEDKDRELMPPPALPIGVLSRSRTKQVA